MHARQNREVGPARGFIQKRVSAVGPLPRRGLCYLEKTTAFLLCIIEILFDGLASFTTGLHKSLANRKMVVGIHNIHGPLIAMPVVRSTPLPLRMAEPG